MKENRCERCGIDKWLDAPLSMALHHVNGDPDDNRLENLSLLCPNCHAQTPNYSGKGLRMRRLTAGLVAAGAKPLVDLKRLPLIGEAT